VPRPPPGPIHQRAYVAEKIQNGDFHVRAPVRSEDEIGKLAQAFNQMTDRLLESNRKLQARIDEQQHDDTPDD
jgi:nitrate/nitrite-specific signal transduction histidine kinase